MAVPTKYYETDLVTTEDIFDVVSLADYLILESIYKIEFYVYTLEMKDVAHEEPRLSVNKEVERIIEKITKTESYNSVFANIYNFVRQDYDNNYQKFLSELIFGRYNALTLNNIINTRSNFEDDDIEGNVISCKLKEPEGRRYFHMIHAHAKFMDAKEKMEKEKNQSMKAMMDHLGVGGGGLQKPSVDIFALPTVFQPPSPEDQKMIHEMFRKMIEESMKFKNNQAKKRIEYEQLKKDIEIDEDFLDENDEYDTFEIDDSENDGR